MSEYFISFLEDIFLFLWPDVSSGQIADKIHNVATLANYLDA